MRPRTTIMIAIAATSAMLATACGEPGESGTEAPDPAAAGEGCAPVAGEDLVVLEDDQGMQQVENILAAVNADVASPELIAALDTVAAALDTPKLLQLNRAVDIDRQTAQQAAEDFAAAEDLTADVAAGSGSGEIRVGTAEFSESQILGELYRIALEAAGFGPVEVTTVGNRELYEPALERGEIQVVPEYLGSLTEFLNGEINGADAEPLASGEVEPTLTALRDLGDQVGLEFGEPSAAANQNAFAVTTAFADEYQVSTLSELAESCSGAETLLGGPPECPQRPFCLLGLQDVYGLSVGPFVSLASPPLIKQGLRSGQISLGLVFTTDADLASG